MPSNETNSATTPGRKLITLAAIAVMSVIAVILMGVMTAQAQSGAVPNLQLSSANPGELTISWDAPNPAPSDYRIVWAKQDLDFPSYKAANEANRGNEYPGGTETSITLTGLAKGETFKARMRARYTSGGQNNGSWSGPWTSAATARVKDNPPAAPTGLTTSGVAHDSVTISWAAPATGTVTGYRVLRGTNANSLSTIAQNTGNTTVEYTDSTVAAETTYHYAVLALSQDGDGARSTTVSATTPAEAQPTPSAPTGLTTYQVVHDSVTISWTTPSQGSVTGYRILRGTDSNSLSAIVQNTDSTATEYTDSTVTAATTYHYAVLALSAEGVGAQSAAVSATTPAAPQQATVPDLRLSSTAAGQLTISWDAPDPTPSDYRILWAKQDLDFPSYTAANEANRGNEYPGGTETSITLTGLAKGETFRAQMRARYTSGGDNNGPRSGPWTDTVTARVKDDPPAAPTGLTASQVAHDSVTLSWTAPGSGSTVTGYRILRGTDSNSLSAIAQDTGSAGTEYTDSTVTAATTYYYAVLALSADGDGAQSATISATTPAAPKQTEDKPPPNRVTRAAPSAPQNLRFQVGDGSLTFIWDAPANGGTLLRYNHRIGVLDGAQIQSSDTTTNLTGTATYTKTGLTNGTTYYFEVRGVNTDGAGTFARIEATPSACNAPDAYPRGARQVWTGKVKARQITASIHRQEAISGFEYDPPRGMVTPNHSDGKGDSELDNPHFSGRHVATIDLLGVTTSPAGTLRLGTTGVIRDEERNQFTLYVCDTPFHFRDASVSGKLLSWSSSGLDWSVHPERTLYIHRDSTAPTVASVEVTKLSGVSMLTITFTEELNLRILPHPSAFAVKKTPAGGSEQTATFTGISYHGKYTWGRALTEVVLPTDRVTVSYAKPTDLFKLQDKFGNDVESFTDVLARKRHEPSGQDFSHSHDTPGFVGVGQDSSGRLPDRSDHRGDTFNLVGLEPSRNYRVEVVFKSAGSTQRFSTRGTSGGTSTPPPPQWAATSGCRTVAISTGSILSPNGTATTTAEPSLTSKPAGTSPATPVGSPLSQTTT